MLMLYPSHNMWETCDDWNDNKTRRLITFAYSQKKHCITETMDNVIIAMGVKLL